MMILKEGQGWSDEQLFENREYNLLIRITLGLMSLADAEPVPSTYYLFRRNLVEYAREHGEDLFKKCQAQITRDQILEFQVSGKQVRMDSKLIGSNIAWYSRYELIHETLRLFIDEREDHIFKKSLPKEVFTLIESIQGEKGDKEAYRSTKAEIDTDCHYRDKDGKKVKGYSVNITETCDQVQQGEAPVVNLITDTQVDVASACHAGIRTKIRAQFRRTGRKQLDSNRQENRYNRTGTTSKNPEE